MGDAGGQAAETGQLHLLRLLGDLRNVFEEDQHVLVVFAVEADKAGLHRRAIRHHLERRRTEAGIQAPLLHAVHQHRAVAAEAGALHVVLPEQAEGGLVGEEDGLTAIDHEDAGAHALQDQCVEFLQVGDRLGAFFGQRFGLLLAPHQSLDHQRGGEAQGAEAAGLDVVVGGVRTAQAEEEGQVEQAEAGRRRDDQADAPAQQDVGNGHRHHQQAADAAGYAATCVEQAAKHQHVGEREDEDRQQLPRRRQEQRDQDVEDQVAPTADMEQFRVDELEDLIFQFAGDQQDQYQADGQAVQVVQTEDALPLLLAQP